MFCRKLFSWANALTGLVLISALVLVVIGFRPLPARTIQGSVKDFLPAERDLPGWTVNYQPIAETPEVMAKINELLNYDDAISAIYTRGTETLSVYIAYWTPGKMSHRLVAAHTPDVCWVAAGWVIGASSSAVQLFPKAGTKIMPPAEVREMHMNGRTEHLVFWHLLKEDRAYVNAPSASWRSIFTDLASHGFDQRREQLFIRISSNQSLIDLQSSQIYSQLVERLSAQLNQQ